ncbi:MAG: hypothetical protein GEV11_11045, partial [Streptosporangiales bacterium]|nr:hypothetical protein [Streptosporangiales bacterium]
MRTLIAATSAKVRAARKHMKDRGQNMLEYVGLVIIVAGVIVGLSGVLGGIKDPFEKSVKK